MSSTMAVREQEALFNHLALPRQLPQREDSNLHALEVALIVRLMGAADLMRDLSSHEDYIVWDAIRRSLNLCKSIAHRGRLERSSLSVELKQLGRDGFLLLYLRNQNAAVFIQHSTEDATKVVIEVFEASPKCEDVLAAPGALQWDFPGSAVSIPLVDFLNEEFLGSFASFLEQASLESTERFAAHTVKAGITTVETRDTPDPGLLSSMLMALLEAHGTRISPRLLRKRVRDDVCWNNAAMPWRRLPFWLVARVGIQRYLSLRKGGDRGRVEYKVFVGVVLLDLLQDVTGTTTAERLSHLRTKLCRRLVKLEADKAMAPQRLALCYDHYFEHLGPRFEKGIKRAHEHILNGWDKFKAETTKTILPLPRLASEQDMRLSLRCSRQHLSQAIIRFNEDRMRPRINTNNLKSIQPDDKAASFEFADQYFDLAKTEAKLQFHCRQTRALSHEWDETKCVDLASKIQSYLEKASKPYDGNAEQESMMILTVMELWMRLDECACSQYPLLKKYHPMFVPEMLDVLLLLRFSDIARLEVVQGYIQMRINICDSSRLSIFEDPCKGCFAQRYYDESADSERLNQLRQAIEDEAARAREKKMSEWEEKTKQYEELAKDVNQGTCMYRVDENNPLGRGLHDPQCRRCFAQSKMLRMRMRIYEHPLPADPELVKVAIFELGGFRALEAYRDTTWLILSRLACPTTEAATLPKCRLRDYSELRRFATPSKCSLVLASTTKPFLNTHYATVSFPTEWDSVCRPNGLKYGYFDRRSERWPGRTRFRPTFAHHCKLRIASTSSLADRINSTSIDGGGPSSYEIVATQSACPAGVNVHEFQALQYLLSGKTQRWICILRELGASNINFSTETSLVIINHLALQCGPVDPRGDSMRMIHSIFGETIFCLKLLEQLHQRLDSLAANWREVHLMDAIITIALKMHSFTHHDTEVTERATQTLKIARKITLQWMRLLREQLREARDASTAKSFQTYVLWAALLCKRTFMLYLDAPLVLDGENGLDGDNVQVFVECSITLQNNLVSNPSTLRHLLKNAVIRDYRMVYQLQPLIRKAIGTHQAAFLAALNAVWPEPEGRPRVAATFESDTSSPWFNCTVASSDDLFHSQRVTYNALHGLLLVDGMPVGQLPPEHQNSLELTELFGNQSLLTYRSNFPGMLYTLCIRPNGYQVHVGIQNGKLIIRTCKGNHISELIPRTAFGSPNFFDLPDPLVENCFHWLDLRTGVLEITQKATMWKSSMSNWVLDTKSGRCSRGDRDALVDPHSPLFHRIARIFDGFELRHNIKVHQQYNIDMSPKPIGVDLPRLQLWFFRNHKRVLQCPRLQAEIDEDQDAGTWYGLHSKLIVRGVHNDQRTVLVPLGKLKTERRGQHVMSTIRQEGIYGKFHINSTLGRMECAPEPRLIYTKALLHAYTSFVIPDPLTGKTGTEEALHWLTSGICQPWMPLTAASLQAFESLAKLTPVREYYPSDLKAMKRERWVEELTPAIQHDAFRSVIDRIIAHSDNLSQFNPQSEALPELPSAGDAHLNYRAWFRWQLNHREMEYLQLPIERGRQDHLYVARDRNSVSNKSYANVLEIVELIRTWPEKIRTDTNLCKSFSSSPLIHGYNNEFDKVSLSDRLNVDIKREWGPLVSFMQHNRHNRSALMFFIAPIALRFSVDMGLLRTLVAFAVFEDLNQIQFPGWPEYEHFRPDMNPNVGFFMQLLIPFCIPPPEDDREIFHELASAKLRRQLASQKRFHEQLAEEQCKALAKGLVEQWPCLVPKAIDLPSPVLVDVERAMKEAICPEWTRLFYNHELSNHLINAQNILQRKYTDHRWSAPKFVSSEQIFPGRIRGGDAISLSYDLMKQPGPVIVVASSNSSGLVTVNGSRHKSTNGFPGLGPLNSFSWTTSATNYGKLPAIVKLDNIVSGFMDSDSSVRRTYGETLKHSLAAFKTKADDAAESSNFHILPVDELAGHVHSLLNLIKSSVENEGLRLTAAQVKWFKAGLLWPVVTPITLLEQLRSTASCQFGTRMRESIVRLGLAITNVQRQSRLNELARKQDTSRYIEEELNLGHSNWNPAEYPDWLLLEIESNFLIRPDQVDVALATVKPTSGLNSLLQMNMGQGKTSCIIPMAAALLADGKHLARVVVPRALLQQTAQMLHTRLGGLLNRQLRHIPFSRRTCAESPTIHTYFKLHKDLQKNHGVVLCLAEHNLSFMLSGQQQLLDSKVLEATQMVNVQDWLKSVSRDILDESDYTLAVRTQLIYPSGALMTVNGHPHRWQVVEAILQLVDMHLYHLERTYPQSIEVVRRASGGFPLMFFLRPDVEDELLRRLTNDICKGNGGVLPMSGLDKADNSAIKDFISSATVCQDTVDHIRALAKDKIRIGHIVYLLRGLLVNRILMMTLKKRWNVQYGLHKNRDPMAVPFHAKGVPSDHSEWGHPDVAILFTCLAFYYDGISLAQLRESLEHCLKSDDPSSEYDRWTQNSPGFPDSLKEWNSVNIEDDTQLHEIWRSVRHSVVVIDYFLNNFVFPRHARQFKVKLQSNGWDIPHFTAVANRARSNGTKALTTGFSGTNDNRTMLPLNIEQRDLPRLSHVNAEVLTYLLHQRNRRYHVMQSHDGKRLPEEGFLQMLSFHRIRILIDAGAQILEMDNITLARKWLEIEGRASGALYFDKENKPWILSRQGAKTPLLASVYADDLSDCLVYIDEAHTRGTDLKLPPHAVGALTLGHGQTKDHTVQAAMRLRQLGTTQAIVFFAPPEVHQSILDLQRKTKFDTIDSVDVIKWLLTNTCDGIEQLQPLYYSQGIDFCKRMQAAIDSPDFLKERDHREQYIAAIKQDEQQTLQQLYEPKFKGKATTLNVSDPRISVFVKELNARRRAFQDTGNAVHASALQEVEQERQVIHEVESVRQVKKPFRFPVFTFPGLHRDLESFARTGRCAAQSDAYRRAFEVLARTSLGRKFRVVAAAGKSNLHVTCEFEKTVKHASETGPNHFLRPVQWILWSPVTETAIIVIPEEAEKLIPIVRDAKPPVTYLLTYATPVTRKMLHFNQLKYYTIPSVPKKWTPPEQLIVELGIFAGRLYFEWHEYVPLCQFLGVDETSLKTEDHDLEGLNDGANEEDTVVATTTNQADGRSFALNTLAFMQEWLAMRRRGQDFVHTPMGFVTHSKPLQESHPFFRRAEVSQSTTLHGAPAPKLPVNAEEDVVPEETGDAHMIHAEDVGDVAGEDDEDIEYDDDEMYHDALE